MNREKSKKPGRPDGSRSTPRPVSPERLYYRPKEVALALGIGLTTVYDGIYRGAIPSRKIGDALLIPAAFVRGEDAK